MLRLREYLKQLAMEHEKETRAMRGGPSYSEVEIDESREGFSDDETIDVPEDGLDRSQLPPQPPRPLRPRSYGEFMTSQAAQMQDGGDDDLIDVGGPVNGNNRYEHILWNGHRPASYQPEDGDDYTSGPSHGQYRRGVSRSASEGQESASRPRFTSADIAPFSTALHNPEAQRNPLLAQNHPSMPNQPQHPHLHEDLVNLEWPESSQQRVQQNIFPAGPPGSTMQIQSMYLHRGRGRYDTDYGDGDDGDDGATLREGDGDMEENTQ